MTARARAAEPYLWLALVAVALGWQWVTNPGRIAFVATAFALAAAVATLLAHGAESRRLRAWYDAELGRADDELDEYDALRALVAPVVAAHPRSAAARRLQAAWPRFARTADNTDDTEEESAAA